MNDVRMQTEQVSDDRMQAEYADVIVDITRESLDRSFQYRIPPELSGQVQEGTAVRIPFGKGTRETDGYVVGLGSEPKISPERIRPILSVISGKISIEGSLIRLAAWMKSTYGSTMNQALKTTLPVRKKEKPEAVETISLLTEEGAARELTEEYRQKRHSAKARLMELLLSLPGHEAGRQEIRAAGITADTIARLEKDGVIRRNSMISRRDPPELAEAGPEEGLSDLTAAQKAVCEGILREWSGEDRPCLLHGITGSGKTLLYIALTRQMLELGRQVIILIPEISLSWQTVRRIRACFGDRIAVLHSRMSKGERYDQYDRIARGEAQIAIGPRSALFTPFGSLGLIIVDEEHETSYRSGQAPRYDARETAIARAQIEGAHVLLGSATPSTDSYYRCQTGEYALFTLPDRYGGAQLPHIRIVDMREELRAGNRSILSGDLQDSLRRCLDQGSQAILFLNRRGYAGFVSCRSCGHVMKCPHCDVSLTSHSNGQMICHYCGYRTAQVTACPSCGSPYIGGFRAGTQKVEQEISRILPGAGILRMDADSTRGKDGYGKILRSFAAHEADILIGTQMVVKGHDFPDVTLSGVLAADLSLFASDYRAAERTYQLLVQAVGRAGRGRRDGEAIIQTYHPEHYSIRAAAEQDYRAFYEEEIAGREMMRYPPAEQMLAIHGSAADGQRLETAMRYIRQLLMRARRSENTELIGPAPESVSRIQDNWRSVLYVKESSAGEIRRLRGLLEQYVEMNSGFREIYLQYDYNV